MDVNEVLLPGVGLRYEFTNADGDRIGVIARRDGGFEVVAYPPEDPDEGRPLFRLTREEADAVAEILGAPRITERFADLSREVPGLVSGRVDVPAASPHAGQALGSTRARTRTGASVVAIVRGESVVVSPTPSGDAPLGPGRGRRHVPAPRRQKSQRPGSAGRFPTGMSRRSLCGGAVEEQA